MSDSKNDLLPPLPSILEQLQALANESPPADRRRHLLAAFLNLALIAEADFVAIQTDRAATLIAVYEEVLLWDKE